MTAGNRSRLAGLVAAALVATAGLVGLTSGAAQAAVCSSSGISAVVDANGAGGGVSTSCDHTAGSRNAAAAFRDVGVSMRRNRDGSVCQVNARPSNASCQGLGTHYWALFWSNGKDGRWNYSQQGVDTLTVPKNGSVAWAWQGGSGQRQPGVSPPKGTAPAPTPTKTPVHKPKPKPKPTKEPQATRAPRTGPSKATAPSTKAPAAASTSARARAKAKAKATTATAKASATASAAAKAASPSVSASAAPQASDDANPEATKLASNTFKSEDEQGGLPPWIPIAVVVVLMGGSAGAVWWRRRSGTA